MNTTVIRASTADLIAIAFYRVGYRPRESLVLVGLHGARQRMGLVIRIDLPPSRHRKSMIELQLRLLRREGDDQLVAMVVSDRPPPANAGGPVRMPHRRLVRDLRRLAARHRCKVVDVLAVGASRWRSYQCPDPACCPSEGFSLDEALSGPAAALLVTEGHVLAADEAGLVADVDVHEAALVADPAPAEAAARGGGPSLLPRPSDRRPPDRPGEDRPREEQAREEQAREEQAVCLELPDARDALNRWRGLLARPSTAELADFAWITDVLDDHWLRDSILLTLVPGSGTVPEEVLAGGDAATLDDVFGADPDEELLERGRVLLSAVARTAPPGRRANALALLAWSAWWAGDGARGRLLSQRALADTPGHRLARLVSQLLIMGVAPEWVERRRTEGHDPG